MAFRVGNFSNLKRAEIVSALDNLNEALEKLEKKEKLLREKASKEVVTAKEFTRAEDETVESTLREKASKEVVTVKEFTRAEAEAVKSTLREKASKEVMTAKEFTRAEDETVKSTLREKASKEVVTAKEFTRAEDETAAIQCVKSKKLYEPPIEHLRNLQLQILEQGLMLEVGEAAAQTLDALTTGAAAMKARYIDDVDNIMYNIKEQHETMKQTIEAVAAPFGAAALFDEDELKAELLEMKGAE